MARIESFRRPWWQWIEERGVWAVIFIMLVLAAAMIGIGFFSLIYHLITKGV